MTGIDARALFQHNVRHNRFSKDSDSRRPSRTAYIFSIAFLIKKARQMWSVCSSLCGLSVVLYHNHEGIPQISNQMILRHPPHETKKRWKHAGFQRF